MAERRDEAAELRELCAGLAIQAGAKGAVQIIGLAEELRTYIQFGREAMERPAANRLPGNASPKLARDRAGQENE